MIFSEDKALAGTFEATRMHPRRKRPKENEEKILFFMTKKGYRFEELKNACVG